MSQKTLSPSPSPSPSSGKRVANVRKSYALLCRTGARQFRRLKSALVDCIEHGGNLQLLELLISQLSEDKIEPLPTNALKRALDGCIKHGGNLQLIALLLSKMSTDKIEPDLTNALKRAMDGCIKHGGNLQLIALLRLKLYVVVI